MIIISSNIIFSIIIMHRARARCRLGASLPCLPGASA